jgi:hypothetical protein
MVSRTMMKCVLNVVMASAMVLSTTVVVPRTALVKRGSEMLLLALTTAVVNPQL